MHDGVPERVREYADQVVAYVRRALGVTLEYDSDTLPLLDHYLRTVPGEQAATLELVVATSAAYFGEVVRRRLGGRWETQGEEQHWRVVLPTGLNFSPAGFVASAIAQADLEDLDSEIDAPPRMRPYVQQARQRMGEVYTHSVSGATTLAQVFGSVDAATISADMDLDTIAGEKLIASANRGRIAGRRVRSREIELTTTEGRIMLEAEAALHGHLVVSSLRGDVEVRLHRHGPVFLRARGTKVDLGQQQTVHPQPNGWSETTIGQGDQPALVELRSTYGMVQFTVVE